MRDNANYRAANIRAQATALGPTYSPQRGSFFGPGCGFPTDPQQEGSDPPLDLASGRRNSMDDQSIGIHSNDVDTIPMECIRNGMDWYPMHWSPLHHNRFHFTGWRRGGKRTNESGHAFTTMPIKQPNRPEVRTMPSCVACGAELEPPVRTPHTVYMKSLYRIAAQDYCRHYIIRAVVAAGVIAEVKAGAGPVTAVRRE